MFGIIVTLVVVALTLEVSLEVIVVNMKGASDVRLIFEVVILVMGGVVLILVDLVVVGGSVSSVVDD